MALLDTVIEGVATGVGLFSTVSATNKARRAEEKAAERTLDLSRDIFNQTRADVLPQIELGQQATNRLNDLFITGAQPLQSTPGSEFLLDRGVEALDRSAASRGRLFSGAQGEALTQFGQQNASLDRGAQFNELAALAGIGQSGVNTSAQAGGNLAGIGGQAITNAGAARSSGFTNTGSGINQSLNNLITLFNRR